MRNIIQTIKGVIVEPGKFFKSIVKDKTIKDAFLFYLAIYAISFVLNIAFYIKSSMWYFVPFQFVSLIFGLAFLFLFALITHGFYMLMKGKGDYTNTFNFLIYAGTPGYLIGIVMAVLNLLIGLDFFMTVPILPVIYGIVTLGLMIWVAVLITIGGSIVHKISKGKSFAAGVLLPMVLAFIIFLFIMMVVGMSIFTAFSGGALAA